MKREGELVQGAGSTADCWSQIKMATTKLEQGRKK